MAHDFNMDLNGQEEWSWLVAIDLLLGGLGGGLFLLFLNLNLSLALGLLSLGLVMLGGAVLLAELGHPLRAWRAMSRPRTSWISRGMITVFVFIAAGLLYVAPSFAVFSWLPWNSNSLAGETLGIIAGVSAFVVTLYPGFVLSASPSIPFWNSPLLPVLFFAQSLLGASGIVILFSPFAPAGANAVVFSLAAPLIAANLVLLAIHLWTLSRSGIAARKAVDLLRRGPLAWKFNLVVVMGMILPLILVLWVPAAAVLAGAFILIGGLFFRYCVLKAGVYVPFALS